MTLIYHPRARLEYEETLELYRERGEPHRILGFIAAVKDSIQEIVQFPEAYPLIYLQLARRKRIAAFPYFLVYCLEPDAIALIAIAHERQEPLYWLGRL